MTDEQRPWRAWPEWDEYRDMLNLVAVTGKTRHKELDALCARAWREAQLRVTAMLSCFCTPELQCVKHVFEAKAGPELGAAWHDHERTKWERDARANNAEATVLFERTRADAAEAQRDRLAAALRELTAVKALGDLPYGNVDELAAYTRREDTAWEVARAALADVPVGRQ